MVKYNCFYEDGEEKPENVIFPFQSFINHGTEPNIYWEHILPNVLLMFALEDVAEGEELVTDYCPGIDKPERRQEILED